MGCANCRMCRCCTAAARDFTPRGAVLMLFDAPVVCAASHAVFAGVARRLCGVAFCCCTRVVVTRVRVVCVRAWGGWHRRTDNAIKNRYYSTQRRNQRREERHAKVGDDGDGETKKRKSACVCDVDCRRQSLTPRATARAHHTLLIRVLLVVVDVTCLPCPALSCPTLQSWWDAMV